MSVEETIEARHEALLSLVHCAECFRGRSELIRRAAQLGVPKSEIARILSLSPRQVSRIANSPAAGTSPAPQQGRTPEG